MMKILHKTSQYLVLGVSALLICQATALAQKPVNPDDASTAALVALCQNKGDVEAQNFCFGFGEGVYQAYLVNLQVKTIETICFANNNDSREMILRKFLKWNELNPQFNAERAAKTLMRFFVTQYPCQ